MKNDTIYCIYLLCVYIFLKRPTRMGFYFFLFLVLVKIKYAQTLLKNIHKKDILGTRAREFCLTNLGVCFRNNIHNKLVFFVCFAFVWYSYRVQRHIFVTIGKQWIMCVFSLFRYVTFFKCKCLLSFVSLLYFLLLRTSVCVSVFV